MPLSQSVAPLVGRKWSDHVPGAGEGQPRAEGRRPTAAGAPSAGSLCASPDTVDGMP